MAIKKPTGSIVDYTKASTFMSSAQGMGMKVRREGNELITYPKGVGINKKK